MNMSEMALVLFICFNFSFLGYLFSRFERIKRFLFLASIFFFVALITLSLTLSVSWAQQLPPKTVYVTVVRTVLLKETVSMYLTVTSASTSIHTVLATTFWTTTEVSSSFISVTLWSTTSDIVTSISTEEGVIGHALKYPLGPYTDVAILGMGVVIGALAALAFSRIYTRTQPGGSRHLCPYCRRPYNPRDDWCRYCGGNIRDYEEPEEEEHPGGYTCTRCGRPYEGSFCPHCGPPIIPPSS